MNRLHKLWEWLSEGNIKKLTFVGTLLMGLASALYTHWPASNAPAQEAIQAGEHLLDVGLYAEAKAQFKLALDANKQDTAAALGLKKAELWDNTKPEAFESGLKTLLQAHPDDPHLNLFMGKWLGAQHELAAAEKAYRKALEKRPALAEAHFDLGVLYAQQPDKAAKVEKEYLAAIANNRAAKYVHNLAEWYQEQGKLGEAENWYGKNNRYPLSALKLATLRWREGQWAEAEALQADALAVLQDKNAPGAADAWYLALPDGRMLELLSVEEKSNFARLCLAASQFMQNKLAAAQASATLTGRFQPDIRAAVQQEMRDLPADERLAAFQQQFLP